MSGIRPLSAGIVEWGESAMSTSRVEIKCEERVGLVHDAVSGQPLNPNLFGPDGLRNLREQAASEDVLSNSEYLQRHPELLEEMGLGNRQAMTVEELNNLPTNLVIGRDGAE